MNFNVDKINKLQRRACKLILLYVYVSLNELLKQLDILSFDQSVFLTKARIMYKIYNNLAPSYLLEMFQTDKKRKLRQHTVKFKVGSKHTLHFTSSRVQFIQRKLIFFCSSDMEQSSARHKKLIFPKRNQQKMC